MMAAEVLVLLPLVLFLATAALPTGVTDLFVLAGVTCSRNFGPRQT